jgi:patatin-related protein
VSQSLEEVRVALALNGGVSLAVWMGGCAVELDCARRAHAGVEELAYDGFQLAAGGTQTRRVYNALCDTFGRRLVLDILTGASAGGINGALLGAAMRARRRLHPQFVRDSWIELGDFSRLLQETTEPEPRSLMRGKLFHADLEKAFGAVLGTQPDGAGTKATALPAGQDAVEETIPKLDVTMTDVAGAEKAFRDEWGGDLIAREHRARFKFRDASDFTAAELATAARTSASFPVAFEPWEVKGAAASLAELDGPAYGIDGGLLDNAPIRAALDLIPGQRASNRVRRYVCYLNADPPQAAPSPDVNTEPTIQEVVGYVVNLPRKAPFVDQLYAVQEATRRSQLAPLIQDPLLNLDLATLTATAKVLLPAYRQRRTALSLDQLLEDPAQVSLAAAQLNQSGERLPWIPASLDPPGDLSEWSWGVRPGQRILHLLLDLIRPALNEAASEEARAALMGVRGLIDQQLARLEDLADNTNRNRAIRGTLEQLALGEEAVAPLTDALASLGVSTNAQVYLRVSTAATEFLALLAAEVPGLPPELASRLFGIGDPTAELAPLEHFLARTLAIEVVRRALSAEAEVETAQPLRFAQLTPSAPTPIFAANPLEPEATPSTPEDKLTGVNLGHFAGFYRRSWRANDYMWGRLDASARVVQILLDGATAADPLAAATVLVAAALPPGASEAARWLAHEALEAKLGDDYAMAGECAPSEAILRPLLEEEIAAELSLDDPAEEGEHLPLTRAVCVRAAQLEILQDELPVLVAESARDHAQGSSSPPLRLPLEQGMRPTIEELRKRAGKGGGEDKGEPLPKQLDDSAEEVSDLGLRTIAHSALVALSAARGAGAPLSKFFGFVRAPLQAVSGSVSAQPLYRLTLAAAFWAASLYLTMRFATVADQTTPLSDIWSRPVLVSLIAMLVVAGVVLVPGLRAWRLVAPGRNGLLAVVFAAVGGVAAALLAYFAGDFGLTSVIFATGAEQLPDWLLDLTLLVAVGLSAVRLPVIGKPATAWLKTLRNGWQLCLPLLVVAIAVAIASAWRLAPVLGDSWWQTVSALAGLAGPLILVGYLMAPFATALLRRLRAPE